MKYVVQLSYTNPAHEHVSLRRRVDTVNRIVEASNENQAILRASQQQRALGFMIKEAKIVKEKEKMKKKEVVVDDNEKTEVAASGGMKEGFDPNPSDIAAYLVDKHGKGKVTKDHVDAYERGRDSNKGIDKEAVMKHVQKMSEDVELDEAQKKLKPSYWRAEWRLGTQSEVDKNNKKIFDKLAKTDPVKASAFHDNLMRMKKKDVKEEVVTEASKEGKDVMRNMRASLKSMDLRHGVDSDKRDAGYKMSPAVKAAQAKSDALSKVVKRPQAGTLAAAKMRNEEIEYIEEKLTAGDPASKWISDFVASDNPKFAGKTKKERINMALGAFYAAKKGKNEEVEHVEEAADPGKLRVVNKKVEAQASKDTKTSEKKSKATEKAIDVAKSKKNPVNLNPVLTGDKVNNA
jgi:hypothetical protein